MLYTLIGILFCMWLIGLVANIGGDFIHGLLVLCGILFVFQMVSGRRVV